jgi:glycosyltransferase involved in cell wall biosynthesis
MRTSELPVVSVVVPCRNEARHIGDCLRSIVAGDYPPDRLEVLVVDGSSDDGTRDVVADMARRHPSIRLLDNPRRATPAGLNAALRAARGDVIARMDAHVVYPPDYLGRLVAALAESGADNVGGIVRTLPDGEGSAARAIALALSHPFGVGNSYFRIGTPSRRWVDTVPFGCYRREVFQRIGPFDEELIRGQDEELNYRLLRAGGRILLIPEVVSLYFARGTIGKVARMYYQYGYFKPIVARKVGRVMTVRQVVPAALVAGLAASGALAAAWPDTAPAFLALSGSYVGAVLACSLHAARRHGLACAAWLPVVFPALHLSYGVGWIRSLLDRAVRHGGQARYAEALPLSR